MATDGTCDDGCPSCVGLANPRPPLHHAPDLGEGWVIPSKAAATLMLKRLLEGIASERV